MAVSTTYNTAGAREDLQDWLTILEPEDCPKTSMFNKTPGPTNRLQEWQADTLAPVDTAGILEGQDVAAFNNEAANRARFGNYIQIFRRPWMVSDQEEASDIAGVSSEVAESKTKAARELKRSIEAAIGSDNDMQADNGSVPWKTRGLGSWISSTAQTVNPVPTRFLTPAGNINSTATGSLTEALFNSVFQSIFTQNGGRRSYSLFAGPNLMTAINTFQRVEGASGTTKTYQVTQDATKHQIDLNVEIYKGSFHTVAVIPDLFNGLLDGAQPSTPTNQQLARGYVVDPALVGIGYMIGMQSQELENQGGGRRGFVAATLALVCKNPRGLGKFAASS
jgi:hypothetical protein